MMRLLRRTATTALKLPVAAAWDALSLGNFGEGSSTVRVLEEHQDQKRRDDTLDVLQDLRDILR